MTKQEEINKLRARLLELGHPIIIRGSELAQPETASKATPQDIRVYPYYEAKDDNQRRDKGKANQ